MRKTEADAMAKEIFFSSMQQWGLRSRGMWGRQRSVPWVQQSSRDRATTARSAWVLGACVLEGKMAGGPGGLGPVQGSRAGLLNPFSLFHNFPNGSTRSIFKNTKHSLLEVENFPNLSWL
jgi:hypothetical protein